MGLNLLMLLSPNLTSAQAVALGAFSVSLMALVVSLKLISKDSNEPNKIPEGRSIV
jgi:hypothetical protein